MKLVLNSLFGIASVTFALAGAANAEVIATQNGAKLTIVGEPTNDVIHVEGGGALGEVNVLQGVTPTLVDSFIGVRDIEIKTGDGNDAVNVSGLEIGGSLKAKLGTGVDFLRIDNVLFGGVTHRSPFIGGGIDAAFGGQAGDSFQCELGLPSDVMTIGGNLSIRDASGVTITGVGTSSNTGEQDIYVGGNVSIQSKLKSNVFLDELNVGGTTKLQLGGGDDTVTIEDSHFVRKFDAKLGSGNDNFDFVNEVEFNSDFAADGGAGDNPSFNVQTATIAGKTTVKNFEF